MKGVILCDLLEINLFGRVSLHFLPLDPVDKFEHNCIEVKRPVQVLQTAHFDRLRHPSNFDISVPFVRDLLVEV